MSKGWLELCPSNWLYNAGVVGFLNVLSNHENGSLFTFKNGCVVVSNGLIEGLLDVKSSIRSPIDGIPFWHYWYVMENELKSPKREGSKSKDKERKKIKFGNKEFDYTENLQDIEGENEKYTAIFIKKYYDNMSRLFSKNRLYASYFPPSKLTDFDYFTNYFLEKRLLKNKSTTLDSEACSFCHLNEYELSPIDGKFMNLLMPSHGGFPNSFWNTSEHGLDKICALCQFIIIHHHLSFTRLSDGTEIFINAPSFELMYRLNRLVREIAISDSSTGRQVLDILGMSLVELASKIQVTINLWTQLNIEVVAKKSNSLDFYSLPQHTVKILTDKSIASILSRIGEFSVLECILEGRYNELLSMVQYSIGAYLRKLEGQTDDKKDHNLRQLKSYFRRPKNVENPLETAKIVLSLYSKIKDRRAKHGN